MPVKTVALILLVLYILLPTLCHAHPCELHVGSSSEMADSAPDQQNTACPHLPDSDSCETTCCCAGYVPLSVFTVINSTCLASELFIPEPYLALPRLMDRIFVPPQNLS